VRLKDWTRVAAAVANGLRYGVALTEACASSRVRVAGARLKVPGPLPIRLSVVAGNIRLHHLLDAALRLGATAVDVGANVGYNTVYAAKLVGPSGRVVAVEPAPGNLQVLRENIATNGLANVEIKAVAAGRCHETRDFFLRGEVSAVNSLYPQSVYASVTDIARVTVAPLDDLVEGDASLVKIDVEGGELEVLTGMSRLLRVPGIELIVEWHPQLQEAAGYAIDALPRLLFEQGFSLHVASHMQVEPLAPDDLSRYVECLCRAPRPVELVARRSARS
jgi:FkbM family methyltransferase